MKNNSTYNSILCSAQRMIQTHGYNGFSYGDLSKELKIATASIHYYFPTKEDLVSTITSNYQNSFSNALTKIENNTNTLHDALQAFINLCKPTPATKDQICLCGMLAGDKTSLSIATQESITAFFDEQEHWVENLLKKYAQEENLKITCDTDKLAMVIISTLQGTSLITRITGNSTRFDMMSDQLLIDIDNCMCPA